MLFSSKNYSVRCAHKSFWNLLVLLTSLGSRVYIRVYIRLSRRIYTENNKRLYTYSRIKFYLYKDRYAGTNTIFIVYTWCTLYRVAIWRHTLNILKYSFELRHGATNLCRNTRFNPLKESFFFFCKAAMLDDVFTLYIMILRCCTVQWRL